MASNDPYQQIGFWQELNELYRKAICKQQEESGDCSYLNEINDTKHIRSTGRTGSDKPQLSNDTGTESGS